MSIQGIQASDDIRLNLTQEKKREWRLKAPGVEGYVIGRMDPDNRYTPDIDLLPFRALEYGISRRHAALVRYQGMVHLVDLGSMNGTFINGERLAANSPYPLQDGDIISIANLDLVINQ